MKIAKHLPNFLTICNLSCGCLAVLAVCRLDMFDASLLVALGAFFDFLDGMAARLLGYSSPIGKELDSLADMVTFGLVPGLIAHEMVNMAGEEETALSLIPLAIALFSALRLAKFNTDERQVSGFIGMPTPAVALLWISFALARETGSADYPWISLFFGENATWPVISLALVSCFLLVSEIPFFSLKFSSLKWQGNAPRFLLLGLSGLLLLIFHFAALPIILLLYLILSLFLRPI